MMSFAEAWAEHVARHGVYTGPYNEEDGFRSGWDAHEQQTSTVEMEAYLDPKDALLDQGVTRLQLLAFLRGDHSERWNGIDVQWIRYRAHSVERESTPDGTTIRAMYIPHDGGLRAATFEAAPGSDQDAAVTLRLIDTIIDAAIAHHGPDGAA